jgi:hypothetical protein
MEKPCASGVPSGGHAGWPHSPSPWTTTANLTEGWINRGTLWSSGYEGPSLVRLDNGSWRIYVDKYTNGGLWTATSTDLNTWTGLSAVGCSGCRHGTAIAK